MAQPPGVGRTLLKIIELLAQKDYVALEELSGGARLRASEIEDGVTSYGRTVVLPPPEAFETIDAVPIRGTHPQAYSVRMRLYTREEGRSDLELQATLIEDHAEPMMRVEIDNILVA